MDWKKIWWYGIKGEKIKMAKEDGEEIHKWEKDSGEEWYKSKFKRRESCVRLG